MKTKMMACKSAKPLPLSSGKRVLDRRCFLKTSALAAAGLAFARLPVMAGPFTRDDFDQLVPADKKLSPDWVQSLFARGARTVYRGQDLEKIGMPIGGICTGQLYLGGDGRDARQSGVGAGRLLAG